MAEVTNGKNPLLEIKGLSKSFGPNRVLESVDLNLFSGEVHALLGPNGSGKSTLVKILMGVHVQDRGEIFYNKKKWNPKDPRVAVQSGIFLIPQEPALCLDLSAQENFYLLPNYKIENQNLINAWEIDRMWNSTASLSAFSAGKRQLLEIFRALSYRPQLLILDEPTARLTQAEKNKLWEALDDLTKSGVAILFITHFLDDASRISQSYTLLKEGHVELSGRVNVEGSGSIIPAWVHALSGEKLADKPEQKIPKHLPKQLPAHSFGKNKSLDISIEFRKPAPLTKGKSLLSVQDVQSLPEIRKMSLEVQPGEIHGILGLVGAGRSSLLKSIFGAKNYQGKIFFKSKECPAKHDPSWAVKNGIYYLSEEIIKDHLSFGLSALENIAVAESQMRNPFFFYQKLLGKIFQAIQPFALSQEKLYQEISTLSGGQKQKVTLSRSQLDQVSLFLLDEPTRGVDISTRQEIYSWIRSEAKKGSSFLISSCDEQEIFDLCDQITLVFKGQTIGTFEKSKVDLNFLISGIAVGSV